MIKKINRRDFLKETSLLSFVATSLSISSTVKASGSIVKDLNVENLIRVYQSATDAISAFLVIVHADSFEFKIRIEDERGASLSYETTEIKLLECGYVIKKVFITGLNCSEKYKFILLDYDYKHILQKTFSSLDLDKLNPKIAFLTCCNHRNADLQSHMFKKLVDSQPDVILILGDLVYANSPLDTFLNQAAKPEEALNSYLKSLFQFDLFTQEQLIPIFCVWDDHDMGFNNANTSHPYKELMLKIFRSFFPVSSQVKAIVQGPGVSFALNAFGKDFIFLDQRFFKNPEQKIFLGSEQKKWLFTRLQSNDLPKLIFGSQQFWNYKEIAESFEKEAKSEFTEVLDKIKDRSVAVLFFSGDVHYSQVQKISSEILGFETYEITSSAMFSSSARFLGKRKVSHGQLAYYGYQNFLSLNFNEADKEHISLKVQCHSAKRERQFVSEIKVLPKA